MRGLCPHGVDSLLQFNGRFLELESCFQIEAGFPQSSGDGIALALEVTAFEVAPAVGSYAERIGWELFEFEQSSEHGLFFVGAGGEEGVDGGGDCRIEASAKDCDEQFSFG